MGTWGPETFQSDVALDYIGDLFRQISDFTDKDLKKARRDNQTARAAKKSSRKVAKESTKKRR